MKELKTLMELIETKLPTGAVVPALQYLTGPDRGQLRLTYDPSLQRALRIGASADAVHRADARQQFAALVELLNADLQPFQIRFLKALVNPISGRPPALKLGSLAAILQVIAMQAQDEPDLCGKELQLVASLRRIDFRLGDGFMSDFRVASFSTHSGDRVDGSADTTFATACNALWAEATKGVIGPWAQESGVTDLVVEARLEIDSERKRIAVRPCRAPIDTVSPL